MAHLIVRPAVGCQALRVNPSPPVAADPRTVPAGGHQQSLALRPPATAHTQPLPWRGWLGVAEVSLAAVAARRYSTRCTASRRRADRRVLRRRGVDSGDRWFQASLDTREAQQAFDAALSERGVAAVAEAATPERRQEAWRYTDLGSLLYTEPQSTLQAPSSETLREAVARLAEDREESEVVRLVFVDGVLAPDFSQSHVQGACLLGGREALADAPVAERVRQLLGELPELDIFEVHARDSLGCAKLAALNQALFEDCACLCLEERQGDAESQDEVQVEVIFLSTGAGPGLTSPRVLIDVGKHRKLRVLESHLSLNSEDSALANGVCRVLVAEGARVRHDLLQQRGDQARSVESLTAELQAGSSYELCVVQSGCKASRLNVGVQLLGEGAECEVTTTMIARGKQQLDLHSRIQHLVPGCNSKQQQKNIVADSAECVFKGAITVSKEAQQTQSDQLCRSLLLSKQAKVKAMPCLQIRADDVSCAHGAAVTDLDQEQIFYMASRGLDPNDARGLLLVAFPEDLLEGLAKFSPKGYGRTVERLRDLASTQTLQIVH